MAATTFDSQLSVFQITDTGAQLRDVSPYIVGIDPDFIRDLNSITALGSGGEEWAPTIERNSFFLDMLWSDVALIGSQTVFGPLLTFATAVAFDFGPQGKGAGDIKYSGTCFVRNWKPIVRVESQVLARVEIKVQGTLSLGTYSA